MFRLRSPMEDRTRRPHRPRRTRWNRKRVRPLSMLRSRHSPPRLQPAQPRSKVPALPSRPQRRPARVRVRVRARGRLRRPRRRSPRRFLHGRPPHPDSRPGRRSPVPHAWLLQRPLRCWIRPSATRPARATPTSRCSRRCSRVSRAMRQTGRPRNPARRSVRFSPAAKHGRPKTRPARSSVGRSCAQTSGPLWPRA